ncbi:intraflagellar transport protein 122 homolog [Cylas formicarius]|uniref:intraflagellar transport protein 122 homolog n=1 Tax=Cylas formicarius TaxID=197179 RepID=UPI0029586994|nr:intraflagellar transport protein 122 homolog [Cylas formicarius]
MRTLPKWVDKIQDSDKIGQSIYDLCFNRDGTQLIVAGGNHVLVYDTSDGSLVQLLKGHKDKVHAVSYARNGEKFASGSADKTVIIWSNKLEGLLKYSHADSVQCVSFNPVSHQLASCSLSDFAFWSSDQKAVQKHKTNARINACSWTNDGQYLALGLANGAVSIRNKLGEEKTKIERPNAASVWAVAWSTFKDETSDTLCVTDWSKTMSFYTLGGKQVGKERQLGFEALKVKYVRDGEYILIAGLNKCCKLYTREGIKLGTIGDQQNSWIWSCEADPTGNFVAIGCEDGTIAFYQLVFNMVHGLHRERYAYRENMTDIIIQHLITEQKVRIKCRDLIKKIAIYTDRLAVQLPERIIIYELFSKDTNDMHYRAREKINRKLDCSLLVVCSGHLIVCQERTLQSVLFTGEKEKEWTFDSPIRYIKNVGGPAGKEGLMLGLKNGQVWEVHLDNVHPLLKVAINDGVRCLDLNRDRGRIAVVDESGLCQVFDSKTGQLCFQEANANSVAFNDLHDDMLAYSGNGQLAIKVTDFPAQAQKMPGFVVGLSGSRVFCLNGTTMNATDLPLSAPMYQFVERRMYDEAYKIACLGVTDGDWEELAHSALEHFDLEIARLAFVKLQDFNYLELIEELKERRQKGELARDVALGDVYAAKGKLKEASRLYQKSGHGAKALTMYTDLRMFDEAREFLGSGDDDDLVRRKADWARNINEHRAAADMYLSVGDVAAAVDIYAEKGWADQLVELGRRLDKSERQHLEAIARHLRRLERPRSAAEIYRRLGDSEAVLRLHVEAKEWAQAFEVVRDQPKYNAVVYVPYARWLAENDRFVAAQRAYHKAGEWAEALNVFRQLTANAVSECRFSDAGFYHWVTCRQWLDLARGDVEKRKRYLERYEESERLARVYYAYDVVHKYLEEPFTSYMPEALFNVARYLAAETRDAPPAVGVSPFAVHFALAKQARKLGANKLAKQTYDKLRAYRVPAKFREQVDVASIASRARPHHDPEDLLPMCYRCSAYNPPLSPRNACVNCGHAFVYSFVGFEALPLVEFEPAEGVSDTEAIRLIDTPPESKRGGRRVADADDDRSQMLELTQDADDDDPFLFRYDATDKPRPLVALTRKQLASLDGADVLVCERPEPLRFRFFKNVMAEIHVKMCRSCFSAFHADDLELRALQNHGRCPFCRGDPVNARRHGDDDDDTLTNEPESI